MKLRKKLFVAEKYLSLKIKTTRREKLKTARKKSITSEGVDGVICGFAINSYLLAIDAINNLINIQ